MVLAVLHKTNGFFTVCTHLQIINPVRLFPTIRCLWRGQWRAPLALQPQLWPQPDRYKNKVCIFQLYYFELIFGGPIISGLPVGGPPIFSLMTLLPSEQLNAVERKGLHTMYDNHPKSLVRFFKCKNFTISCGQKSWMKSKILNIFNLKWSIVCYWILNATFW